MANKTDKSRRQFIASSLTAVATASLVTVTPFKTLASSVDEHLSSATKEIPRRKLGRTGYELPVLSMGAGACNDPSLVQACYEAGMRHFDTAAVYGYGRNEQMVGRVLKKMDVRSQAYIGTKVLTPAQRNELTSEQTETKLFNAIRASLKRLKTDYIDILYIHDVRNVAAVKDESIMKAVSKAKSEGLVKHIGISTHSDMANVINATVEAGIYDIILTSINFTMKDDTALLEAIANAAKKGLGVVGMKTQAGGARFPNPDSLRNYDSRVINSAALKWVLRNTNIHTAITGCATFDQLRENMETVLNLDYSEKEADFLNDNSVTLGMGFCRQCKTCLASCPEGTNIPDLMRTHMYAAQYADFEKAKRTLTSIHNDANLVNCTICDGCVAGCVNDVNIPQKIEELKLIYT